jgi:single-stranded-DNA-specific exonuclease
VNPASLLSDPTAAPAGSGEAPIACYEAPAYSWQEAERIAAELGLAEPVAVALVRRGHRTVEQARAFLAADERHDPGRFEGIGAAVEAIAKAIAAGRRITVHGDYDVDGICATAITVAALRRAGAECDWLIPDRSRDGYGLSAGTIERIAGRGSGLLISVDCGITSVAEVAAARAAGLEVVVTDHHQPGEELPDCPIVHPLVGGYPYPHLCGAAVAMKLVAMLERRLGGGAEERDLDLVALATVADMVPLTGENRSLARRGIAELRRGRRPGVRALAAAVGIELEHLDEGDIGFRLAPRLNAAGRLYRADAGVELMLSGDEPRAAEIARELDGANHERRETERAVLAEAEKALRELPEEDREAPGLVLAGEGWHPGVVGIVASRIAERHRRPALVIALGEDGRGKGSGRSIPGFDLLAALRECSEHLLRFGGHRAAAGVEVEAGRIEALRRSFAAAARAAMPDGPPQRLERIDAVVGAEALGHDVAEQLAALGPFGQGNPEVRLLVPWARVGDLRPMGEGGRHARFHLSTGGSSARGVAFNGAAALERAAAAPCDLTVRLELNHWNGAVEPRVILGATRDLPAVERGSGGEATPCGCARQPDAGWWQRFEAELELGGLPVGPPGGERQGERRRPADARAVSAVARITELLSSGERVLVLCADSARRASLAAPAASPERFGASGAISCAGCPPERLEELGAGAPALVLTEWSAFAAAAGPAAGFDHLVAVDPPPSAELALAAELSGPGWLHRAWAREGDDLAERCWSAEWSPRAALAEIYRALGAAELRGTGLGAALAGSGRFRRRAEIAARCVAVLGELGIAELGGSAGDRSLRVVSSRRTELECSATWRVAAARHEEGLRYLRSRRAEP